VNQLFEKFLVGSCMARCGFMNEVLNIGAFRRFEQSPCEKISQVCRS
jgi:hypothetical protein